MQTTTYCTICGKRDGHLEDCPTGTRLVLEPVAHAATLIRGVLHDLGIDPDTDGMRDTPMRFARALADMTSGLAEDPANHLRTFDADGYDEIVVVRDIPVRSLCEHHLLPFVGVAHVAYLPAGRIVGLSKLARLVDGYARRPQVQERLTMQIASTLADSPVEPKGVAVVVDAEHMCMTMRGVKAPGTRTLTSVMLGRFREHPPARAEVLDLLRKG